MRVFVAPLQSERQVTSQAQSAQRVTDLVGVGALVGRRLPHVLDEGVEARIEVVDVGDIADELVEGLAECAVQRWAPRRWALAAGRDDTTARQARSTLDGRPEERLVPLRGHTTQQADPVDRRRRRPVEPCVGCPELAIEFLSEHEIVRVIGGLLVELACKRQGAEVEGGDSKQLDAHVEEEVHQDPDAVYRQFLAEHSPMQSVRDLKRQQVWGSKGDARLGPPLTELDRLLGVDFFDQPLHSDASVDDNALTCHC